MMQCHTIHSAGTVFALAAEMERCFNGSYSPYFPDPPKSGSQVDHCRDSFLQGFAVSFASIAFL